MPGSARSPSPARKNKNKNKTSASATAEAAAHYKKPLVGVTLDGTTRFTVPDTPDTLEALLKWYTLPSLITWGFFALSAYLATPKFPSYYIVALAVFWRLMYDIVLGYVLHKQSQTAFLTTWVENVKLRGPKSKMFRFTSYLIDTTMGNGHNALQSTGELPSAYSAWILARFGINVILPNDVFAFCMAALRFANVDLLFDSNARCDWEEEICLSNYLVLPICAALMITGMLSKVSAHHVIGQFAWFWGDFFYKVEQELTFDGVFELTPHPMYTVGYGWAYAVGLLSRSYVVLALAMGSHLWQMFFLQFVETPHIEKLYGSESREGAKQSSKSNLFVVKNFDWYRSSDVALVLVIVLLVVAVVFGSWNEQSPLASDAFFVGHALFWRAVCQLVMAYVLVKQERTQFWTKHFVERMQSTEQEAFENWKRLMNLLTCVQHISFLLCAWRLFQVPAMLDDILNGLYALRVLTAIGLWGVAYWSFSSTFDILGDFGWFYGDFFMEPPEHAKLTYTGIYRFLNNPDAYLGHFWMYAVALLCNSWELLVVGFVAQSAHVVFLQLVEKPHLKALYQNKVRPHSTAVEGVLKRKLSDVVQTLKKVETIEEEEEDSEESEEESGEEEEEFTPSDKKSK